MSMREIDFGAMLAAGAGAASTDLNGIHDVPLRVDNESVAAAGSMTMIGGISIIRGTFLARHDLLFHVDYAPHVALIAMLHGRPSRRLAPGDLRLPDRVGAAAFIVAPPRQSSAAVADVVYERLRINFTLPYFYTLADRYPDLFEAMATRAAAGSLFSI